MAGGRWLCVVLSLSPLPAVPDPQPRAADLAVPHLEFLSLAWLAPPTPSSLLDGAFSVGTSLAPGSLSHLSAQV